MRKKIIKVFNELVIDYNEYSKVDFLEKKFSISNVICVNNIYIEVDDSFNVLLIWDMNGNFIDAICGKSFYCMMFQLGMYISNM